MLITSTRVSSDVLKLASASRILRKPACKPGGKRFACRRQGDRSHAAVEEFDAEIIFQSANLMA